MALSFLWPAAVRSELSSEQLYSRYQLHNDISALEQLIAMHGNALYHFLLRQSDRALAEDISQQCWLKLVSSHAGFAGQSNFKTWLFSMARHQLIDELRRLNRWQWQELNDDTVTVQCCPEQTLAARQHRLQFNELISLLPFAQREALMLQLEGFSLEEICQITAQGSETIKSRLRYARHFLQQHNTVTALE